MYKFSFDESKHHRHDQRLNQDHLSGVLKEGMQKQAVDGEKKSQLQFSVVLCPYDLCDYKTSQNCDKNRDAYSEEKENKQYYEPYDVIDGQQNHLYHAHKHSCQAH